LIAVLIVTQTLKQRLAAIRILQSFRLLQRRQTCSAAIMTKLTQLVDLNTSRQQCVYAEPIMVKLTGTS